MNNLTNLPLPTYFTVNFIILPEDSQISDFKITQKLGQKVETLFFMRVDFCNFNAKIFNENLWRE